MPHLAALVPAAKAPLEVKEVETSQPGPHELLVKNEIIALQPVDAKIAKVAMLPLEYPAILGSAFGGTVEKVGAEVTGFNVGDKVVAAKAPWVAEKKYSAYQEYVVSSEYTTTKLPNGASLETAVRLVGNLPTLPSLFQATLNLTRPDPENPAQPNGKKVLIYGGTSSIGSLSVQYLKQAGYEVVTTTSPQHKDFVSQLGASISIDHRQSSETLVKELIAAGPYDVVLDTVSAGETVKLNAEVVAAQGGGDVYALQPPFTPDTLPEGVSRKFEGWSFFLAKEENAELLKWTFGTYFPKALAKNSLKPVAERKVPGGLKGLNDALDLLFPKGVSSQKVVVDLRE
ncbi:alcohol dehydrogenase [Colletotrichum tofieldiae]|uniref:Alcohol dehydrogenase n=1 Tax=Colletotrichum tofieldiae TaxID=708197 RepID=A0A161VP67_9PEZI|nr:alcohol dehydrogenase [Colletotrichum tofieldiae]GKT52888.1 alcohol dehydrogenase [Colletotrichum tofieldiae]GKT80716.1 alcohol dehydrogenase [Colletotrichum tofieldiae]GKT88845.1 alcohol dehydrogenase [Colletotrichum tofieldiae]